MLISSTRPIRTPATVTGERTFKLPMFSNSTLIRYPCSLLSVLMLLTFIASTNSAANPSATNTPTQISSVFDCFISITEHYSRQHEIEAKHGERRVHDGAGGRAAHTLGRRRGIIPFIYRDPRGGETERRALDDTVHHVLVRRDARLHL